MGGKTRDVYDFLLSIDYAWCLGPVDSMNQMWVKEKPIWCGYVDSRRNIHVRLPDLFGGDNEGEGGVEGCVEFYPGSSTQFMSDEYAYRFPDPDNPLARADHTMMPAAREVCHTFFRGGPGLNDTTWDKILTALLTAFGYDPTNPQAATSEAAEIGDTIDRRNFEMGFKWAANNPYIGDTEASISRFPKAIPGSTGWKVLAHEPGASVISRVYADDPIITGSYSENMAHSTGGETHWITADRTPTGYDSWTYALHRLEVMPFDQQTVNDGKVSIDYEFKAGWGAGCSYNIWTLTPFSAPEYPYPSVGALAYEYYWHEFNYGASFFPGTDSITYKGLWPQGYPGIKAYGGQNDYDGSGYAIINKANFTWYPHITHCTLEGGSYLLGDANPAQIIYELLTNTLWGAAEPVSSVDVASFLAANDTLFEEGFGLSFVWTRQSEVKEFIQEVLDHIQAVLYIDPQTGLWTLKLLRADYDPATLEVLDPTNFDIIKSGRRGWGKESVNEIVVVYTNPDTNEDASVSSHADDSIAMTGDVVSETRNYHGVQYEGLAQKLADRDVAQSSFPAYSASGEAPRSMWTVTPGKVYKLVWPEDGIADMVVRVMDVDYGSTKDRKIKIEILEDIFAREVTAYVAPQGSLWSSGSILPRDLPKKMLLEAPMSMLQIAGFNEADIDAAYPGGVRIIPFGYDDERFITSIDVTQTTVNTIGVVEAIGSPTNVQPIECTPLTADMLADTQSTLPWEIVSYLTQGAGDVGSFFVLTGPDGGTDEVHEIIYVSAFDGTDWTVYRGVWDTQPQDWVAGSLVWRFPKSLNTLFDTEFASGDSVSMGLLPRTSKGVLALTSATLNTDDVSGRPHQPYPPKNMRVIETGSGTTPVVDFTETIFTDAVDPLPTSFDISWDNRNRLTEEDVPMYYDEGPTTAEVGQTTTVRVRSTVDGSVIEEHDAGTATSYVLPVSADMASWARFTVELVSVKGGIECLQPASKKLWLQGSGWNYGWNMAWNQ